MLKSFLTLTLRRLKRQLGYTFINVAGLAVGMTCCLLIGLYVKDELSFDRFHEHADRIFTFSSESRFGGVSLSTPYPLASTLAASLPEVERAVRTSGAARMPVIREDVQLNVDQRVLLSGSPFFEMFTFPTISGDPVSVLSTPNGAVITESTARTFFGAENPIGHPLKIEVFGTGHEVTVGAVVQDPPVNSTIQFDIVAPFALRGAEFMREDAWGMFMYRTYVLTKEALPADVLDKKVAGALAQHFANTRSEESAPEFNAHPLTEIYLSGLFGANGFKGQYKYLYIFGSVALFVLLIAAVNYVNLVTAQATQRAREVGVRKTLGADRRQLVRQFLGESILLSVAALAVALILTGLALPAFNRLFDKNLTLAAGEFGVALVLLCAFVLLVAIVAGAYPAFVLSHFRPMDVLRGAGSKSTPSRGRHLRKGLVVLQFAISVALITGTAIIYQQLAYIQNKDLGFDGEQVVVVDFPAGISGPVRETFKQNLLSDPGVLRASVANGLPGKFGISLGKSAEDISSQARTEDEVVQMMPAVVDFDFLETLGISVRAGRGFSEAFPADLTRAYVLNEAGAREMGWSPAEAVGKPFKLSGSDDVATGEVVGVVEDFHIASLHEAIDPIVLQLREDDSWSTSYVLIAKLAPEHVRDALGHIERQFARIAPGRPFEYEFLDDQFDAMYRTEQRLGAIFTTFAALAILIASLGLFGLAAFTAERRTKEIGIRKVLGATVTSIVALLSKDFLRLVLIAFVFAMPLAYVVMNRWLEDFAYRIEIGPGNFLLSGMLALLVAVATVGFRSIRAALSDPVKSLRYE